MIRHGGKAGRAAVGRKELNPNHVGESTHFRTSYPKGFDMPIFVVIGKLCADLARLGLSYILAVNTNR